MLFPQQWHNLQKDSLPAYIRMTRDGPQQHAVLDLKIVLHRRARIRFGKVIGHMRPKTGDLRVSWMICGRAGAILFGLWRAIGLRLGRRSRQGQGGGKAQGGEDAAEHNVCFHRIISMNRFILHSSFPTTRPPPWKSFNKSVPPALECGGLPPLCPPALEARAESGTGLPALQTEGLMPGWVACYLPPMRRVCFWLAMFC